MDYEKIKILFIGLIGFAFALIAYILLLWHYYRKKIKKMAKDKIDLLQDIIEANSETLKANFTSVRAMLLEKHDIQINAMNGIKEDVKKINGRVAKLEETTSKAVNDISNLEKGTKKNEEKIKRYALETKKTRFFEKNPLILILLLVGIFAAATYEPVTDFITKIIKLIF